MPNVVFVVGLGPGDPRFLTAQAQSALQKAEVLCGYTVYLDLVRPYYPEKEYYRKQQDGYGTANSLFLSLLVFKIP